MRVDFSAFVLRNFFLSLHGECSSRAEHWTVAPGVGGSKPLTHPNRSLFLLPGNVSIASVNSSFLPRFSGFNEFLRVLSTLFNDHVFLSILLRAGRYQRENPPVLTRFPFLSGLWVDRIRRSLIRICASCIWTGFADPQSRHPFVRY